MIQRLAKNKIEKDLDTVKAFREIKNKISKDIKGMTFEQLQAYLEETKLRSKRPESTKCFKRHMRGDIAEMSAV